MYEFLKRCPYCGEKVEISSIMKRTPVTLHCGTCNYFITYSDIETLLSRWNKRPLEEALLARAEKAEKKLAEIENQRANDLYNALERGIRLANKYSSMTNEDLSSAIINGPWAGTEIYTEFSTLLETIAERLKSEQKI